MDKALKSAFNAEMDSAINLFRSQHFKECFAHLERAHILGQRSYLHHLQSHWWMLKVGIKINDQREVFGQFLRLLGSAGSLFGIIPIGNTGGANVSPTKSMEIPTDLARYFTKDRRRKFSASRVLLLLFTALTLVIGGYSAFCL
ncbi:MAG: hypothetical protein COB37_09380 [Kordiimonadales bacterium]|nr:MAG: hypothetical protein COB37_09380 [Kordiimonadales bacterium]